MGKVRDGFAKESRGQLHVKLEEETCKSIPNCGLADIVIQ